MTAKKTTFTYMKKNTIRFFTSTNININHVNFIIS